MTTVGFLTWNTEPMEDSRGHQGTAESATSRLPHPTDRNGAWDSRPEDSQCDKILLLGAGEDMTKMELMIS